MEAEFPSDTMSSYYVLIWVDIRHLVGGIGEDLRTMVEMPMRCYGSYGFPD